MVSPAMYHRKLWTFWSQSSNLAKRASDRRNLVCGTWRTCNSNKLRWRSLTHRRHRDAVERERRNDSLPCSGERKTRVISTTYGLRREPRRVVLLASHFSQSAFNFLRWETRALTTVRANSVRIQLTLISLDFLMKSNELSCDKWTIVVSRVRTSADRSL